METRSLQDDLTLEQQLDLDAQWRKNHPAEDLYAIHDTMDDENNMDLVRWLADDRMVGLVSESCGGIIGYVHEAHRERVRLLLNLGSLALANTPARKQHGT